MDEHFVSKNKEQNKFTSQSSLQIINRRNSIMSSCRTVSPVAFFHDNYIINRTDIQKNCMEIQRRAQAIATAPRRKRHDDDDDDDDEEERDNEAKKTLLGYIKTSAVPIAVSHESAHPHSLPQFQTSSHLLPIFRIDPPSRDDHEQLEHPLNRYPSAPLPTKKTDWKD